MTGDPDGRAEISLPGGTSNRGLVVRVGDTVRRPRAVASEGVHALLKHLEEAGFDGSPRLLGNDEQGREVLTYIDGEVPIAPAPDWALSDEALISVGNLLRRYHLAARAFDPRPFVWPTSVPTRYAGDGGLVCHNDLNLDNIVFRAGKAVGLIDFDLASPGSELWDVALAARLWVPLRDPRDVTDRRAGLTAHRLHLLADAYGLTRTERRLLAAAAGETHDWSYDIVGAGARRGQPGYVEYWTSENRRRAGRGRRWLKANVDALQRELS